ARMDAQVATDPPARIGEPLTIQDVGGVDGAGGPNHTLRANLEARAALDGAGVRVDHRADHANRVPALHHNAVDATAAEDGCAGTSREREVGHVHAELGVQRAAERADAGTVAAAGVAADRATAIAELSPALVHDLSVRPHDVGADRSDILLLLDLFEQRAH